MSLTDMCRLCLSKDNLVWVFDRRFENNDSMKCVIFVMTGVQIYTTDAISQKICDKCCHIVIKMFEFRKKSLENDRRLREKLKNLKGDKFTTPLPVEIKEEPTDPPEDNTKPTLNVHPTVQEIFALHPQIKMPRVLLNMNMKPYVTMQMGEVENYFLRRNLNFQEQCRLVLKPKTTARKKTAPRAKIPSTNSSPCSITGQIIPQEIDNTDENVLRPIKIKIISNIPVTGPVEAGDVPKISETESDASETEKTASCHKKRTRDEESPTKENEKPEDTEAYSKLDQPKPLSYVTNVSEPLHVCNICYSVHCSAKDLKRHRLKHLRCEFCKTTFRSQEMKTEHVEKHCLIKDAIKRRPCLELPKIENDLDVLKKYRSAFVDYASVINVPDPEPITPEESEEEPPNPKKPVAPEFATEIIEILSDDDDVPTCNTKEGPRENPPPAKIPQVTSAIKPAVKIRNNTILDDFDPNLNEVSVLKTLLTRCNATATKGVQTDDPDPKTLKVDEQNMVAVFTDVKRHLHSFRVPVEIKDGETFRVSYKPFSDEQKFKNMLLWNDLTPVDIKDDDKLVKAQSTCGVVPDVQRTGPVVPHTSVPKNSSLNVVPQSTLSKCDNISDSVKNTDVQSVLAKASSSTHRHVLAVEPSALFACSPPKTTISQSTSVRPPSGASSSGNMSSSDSDTGSNPKRQRMSPPAPRASSVQSKCSDKPSVNVPPPSSHLPALRNLLLKIDPKETGISTPRVYSNTTRAKVTADGNSYRSEVAPMPAPSLAPPISQSTAGGMVQSTSVTTVSFKIPQLPKKRPVLKSNNIFKNTQRVDSPSDQKANKKPSADIRYRPPTPFFGCNDTAPICLSNKTVPVTNTASCPSNSESSSRKRCRPPTPFVDRDNTTPICLSNKTVPVTNATGCPPINSVSSQSTVMPNNIGVVESFPSVSGHSPLSSLPNSVGYSNAPVMVASGTTAQPLNSTPHATYATTSASYVGNTIPPNQGNAVNVARSLHTYFPPPYAPETSNAYSKRVVTRGVAVIPTVANDVSCRTLQPRYSNPITNVRIRNRRNSLPTPEMFSAVPPPYSVAVTSRNNNNHIPPFQAVNTAGANNSFPILQDSVGQSLNCDEVLRCPPTSTLVDSNQNNIYNNPNPVPNTFHDPPPPTSTPSASCSVTSLATPQIGQIRVKNMWELT